MATVTYTVVTPVLADKRYAPGSAIDLDESDAAPLLKTGAIKVPEPAAETVVVVDAPAVALGASTLAKMTVAELTAYATAHKVEIDPAWSKDELLTMVTAAAAAK